MDFIFIHVPIIPSNGHRTSRPMARGKDFKYNPEYMFQIKNIIQSVTKHRMGSLESVEKIQYRDLIRSSGRFEKEK